MRILFISAFPPNKKTAGQNYTRLLLHDLSKDNEISLYYCTYPGHSVDIDSELDVNSCRRSLFHKVRNFFFFPFLFPFFTSKFSLRLLFKIRRISKSYDLLYFDFSQTFIYSLFVNHQNKVFMSHDVIYQMFSRKKYGAFFLNLVFIRLTENCLFRSAKKICCFSEKDKDLILKTYGKDSLVVSFYIDPLLSNLNTSELDIAEYFVLYGSWSRKENMHGLLWFLDNVYVRVSNKVKLVVIGGGLNDFAKRKIQFYSNIQYLGFVENPYPYIYQAKAVLAPLFMGAGVKVKVIESLAAGTPVIGTNIAFEGIKDFKVNGFSPMILACSSDEFVAKILELDVNVKIKTEIKEVFTSSYFNNKFINLMPYITKCK